MRTLIAWEPEHMAEVVRIVADLGRTEVQPGVPDVMTGLPTGSASGADGEPPPAVPDSAVGEFPGFLGEYLVGEAGVFYAVEGTQSNDLTGSAGECTEDTVTLDWARFECQAAQYRFEFDMRTEMVRIDPLPSPTPAGAESHELALGATTIGGVRLEVAEWLPPDPPPTAGRSPTGRATRTARRFDWGVAGVEVRTGQAPGARWQATSTVELTGLPPTSAGRNCRPAMWLVTACVSTES